MLKRFALVFLALLLVACQSDGARQLEESKDLLCDVLEAVDELMFARFGADSSYLRPELDELEKEISSSDDQAALDAIAEDGFASTVGYCLFLSQTPPPRWAEVLAPLAEDHPQAWERYSTLLDGLVSD